MPARRKPNQLLQDRRPSRRRSDPPECQDAPGNAPEHLNEAERGIWRELLDQAPDGVLSRADRPSIEQACRLLVQARAGTLPISGEALLHKILSGLGAMPGGRVALAVPMTRQPQDDNPFAALRKNPRDDL